MNIAIDGPGSGGKSTAAKALAKELKIAYLDTGAMYRGIAYYALLQKIDVADETAVLPLLDELVMKVETIDGVQHVFVNGVDTTPYIRENSISMAASTISKIPAVRKKLVELQRIIAAKTDCVLDGRDIGSYVLPHAEYKFYLTADVRVRAERRRKELAERGQIVSFEDLLEEIEKRDRQDMTRAFAPLVVCEDATVIDTSDLTPDQVLDKMKKIICG